MQVPTELPVIRDAGETWKTIELQTQKITELTKVNRSLQEEVKNLSYKLDRANDLSARYLNIVESLARAVE